ncbi:cobalamin-binding protein [Lyngbya confervoides]|uniref:Cobalamin-binding protein n=1 Tax=Lyngbya confervoides BDU141951 TaxID=1574623 RepID=A0ABD4T4S0_9CYAN|nr:cobalamin-binding protein [Lyngbya confervoides]MCM1983498.1 cobalamin-binding protein [Lyngbya confervoides BDU141951]
MSSSSSSIRIVSLIPSATEIVQALGCLDALVARSHACDYPPQVLTVPVCTAPNLDPHQSSGEIHHQVSQRLQRALSIYRLDLDMLRQLQPTHILTQAQCEVCAVSLAEVEAALSVLDGCSPQVISLQPKTLSEVWQDILNVGQALGVKGDPVVDRLRDRLCQVQRQPPSPHPRVVCLEWTDPLMVAGNWVPELVALAGGQDLLGQRGQHSDWITWDSLIQIDPDVIVLMPCGFNLRATREAAVALSQHPNWRQLQAVQTGQVYLTDGNQYFNRPGPRLVDSLEILGEILHPRGSSSPHPGWERFQ